MEEAVEILANNYDRKINDPIVSEAYNFIKNNENDHSLKELLNQQYRPTFLNVGTVGAYLWGAKQNFYGSVSKSCSALNLGALDNINDCQYQIWFYDQELISKGHSSSSKAYIYVNNEWEGFQNKDIDKLKEFGIEYASILTTINSKHDIVIPMTSINTLPILKEHIEQEEKSDSYSSIYIIIFFILIVLTLYYIKNKKFF